MIFKYDHKLGRSIPTNLGMTVLISTAVIAGVWLGRWLINSGWW